MPVNVSISMFYTIVDPIATYIGFFRLKRLSCQEVEGWDPNERCNPSTLYCMSLARKCFSVCFVMVIYMFNELRREVIVRFVKIGGKVDQIIEYRTTTMTSESQSLFWDRQKNGRV